MAIHIGGWQWDEGNLTHLGTKGRPTRQTVLQVAVLRPKFRINTSGRQRAASHQMVGHDASGTIWVICIVAVPTAAEADIWRAVTGWVADEEERAWLRRQG